jgi:murein DD-endopeptidase MepM/ murein hydrolase activator NlpD
VNCDRRLTLQLVRADGTRIIGLSLSTPVLVCAGAAVVLASLGAGHLVAHWSRLDYLARAGAAASEQGREHRGFIDRMGREFAQLRREVERWRPLHRSILEALGPAGEAAEPGTGIGGPVASPPRPSAPGTPSAELNALAAEIHEAGSSLRALQGLLARASRALAALPSTWPVRGAVNSEFGTRFSPWSRIEEFHAGIDIAAPRGTEVRAPATGTVTFAGAHSEYGLAVVVDHGQDISTVYAHLSRLRVARAQAVTRGMVLGLTGSTGRSSGPHLHYEILVSGRPVNPRSFFWD